MPVLKYYCGHCFKEIEIEPHIVKFLKEQEWEINNSRIMTKEYKVTNKWRKSLTVTIRDKEIIKELEGEE